MEDQHRPIRQGDVILIPRGHPRFIEPPKDLVAVSRDGAGRLVLAEGEVTGHAHVIHAANARLGRSPGAGILVLFVTGVPVDLDHEEHGLAPIEQRTIDPQRVQRRAPASARPVRARVVVTGG